MSAMGSAGESSSNALAAIPQLLTDLTHAVDLLLKENEALRGAASSQAPAQASTMRMCHADAAHPPQCGVSTAMFSAFDNAALEEMQLDSEVLRPLPSADESLVRLVDSSVQLSLPDFTEEENQEGQEYNNEDGDASIQRSFPITAFRCLREDWMEYRLDEVKRHIRNLQHSRGCVQNSMLTMSPARVHSGDIIQEGGLLQHLIIHPHSWKGMLWDMLSVLILAMDLLLAPMFAFGVNQPQYSLTFSASFWSLDVIFQFFIGIYSQGVLDTRPSEIASKYLKTSFLFDMTLVTMDWAFVIIGNSEVANKLLRWNKAVRFFRFARVIRMLRIFKLVEALASLDLLLHSRTEAASETVRTVSRNLRKILAVVIVNHFIACAWYGLSVFTEDTFGVKGWASALPSDYDHDAPSAFYNYTTALHWALTQFTPASMEVHPLNAYERLFTVFVMLLSVLAFSWVVASMTSSMTQLMNEKAHRTKQKELVNRYILERKVSLELSTRIDEYLTREMVRMEERALVESEVALLGSLPEALQRELHAEVHTKVLLKLPVLSALSSHDPKIVVHICHKAMADEFLFVGNQLWCMDDVATKMYFVQQGDLLSSYRLGALSTESRKRLSPDARAGDILSEHALWLNWRYLGDMCGMTDVNVVTLSAEKFVAVVQNSVAAVELLFRYADCFQQWVHHDSGDDLALVCNMVAAARLAKTASERCAGPLGPPAEDAVGRAHSSASSNNRSTILGFITRLVT